ncbi:hypothetical protein V499_03301 [Pseudogymnoascus sp. VKM F-103]|nr:hypothetical protein V499_03301 [Pseudogymnoascus sp. VKM F-103]
MPQKVARREPHPSSSGGIRKSYSGKTTTKTTASKRLSYSAVEPGDPVPHRKKHRYRPGTVALQEIRNEGDRDDARAEESGAEVAESGDSGVAGGGGGVFGAFV